MPIPGRGPQASRRTRPRPCLITRRTSSCSRTRPRPHCAPGTPGTPAGSSCCPWATMAVCGGWFTLPPRLPSCHVRTISEQDSGSGDSDLVEYLLSLSSTNTSHHMFSYLLINIFYVSLISILLLYSLYLL